MKIAIPLLGLVVLALASAASAGQAAEAAPAAEAPKPAVWRAPVSPVAVAAPTLMIPPAAPAALSPPAEAPPKEAPPPGAYKPGGFHILVTGDADVTFTARRHGRSMWEGALSPLFLIQFNDRLLMELAIESDIATNPLGGEPDRNLTLGHANLSYIVCDRLAVGAGIFHTPFGVHVQHYGPPWINQFPDDPLPFADRSLVSEVALGAFATGAAPVGTDSQINYSMFIGDGSELITDDPDAAGDMMHDRFHNFEYKNRNQGAKSIGGRVGFVPTPGLEFGASVMGARVNPEHFRHTTQVLWGLDASYVHDFEQLKGRVRARAEWIWSNTQERTFDPDGSLGFGPLRFNNNRNGGYWQISYRPTQCGNDILKNAEFGVRYDRLTVSHFAPGGGNENRWTPCVAYWFTPSAVAKVAYEYDRVHGMPADHFLIVQFAIGF